jgi:hypothetical protein
VTHTSASIACFLPIEIYFFLVSKNQKEKKNKNYLFLLPASLPGFFVQVFKFFFCYWRGFFEVSFMNRPTLCKLGIKILAACNCGTLF